MALKKVLVPSISMAALILGIRLIAPCRRPGARRKGAVRAKRSEEETRALVQRYGQSHVLEHWEELDSSQQERLLEDLSTIDFPFLTSVFRKTQEADERQSSASAPSPVEDSSVIELSARTADQVAGWRDRGLRLIAEGKVAILLLAGGQGTRLGSSMPKGCYRIGLPSGKPLFQLQAERLQRLQALARQRHPKAANPPLRWYIMTSKFTDLSTKAYFEDQRYFDLHLSQVHFFQQDFLPCLSMDGAIIMQSRSAAAKAPNGNGGVYLALEDSGVLDDMEAHGIRFLDCYSVDNVLARLGDPVFLGACSERGAELAARVVAKSHPQESVGVFCEPAGGGGGGGGGLSVVEYSELPPEAAAAVNPATGRALYNWGNICMHFFTTSFLRKAAQHVKRGVRFHKAVKSIPSKDGPVQGIKLEYFIFDPFHLARSSLLFEVERSAEFAPVKNAPGSASDSPDTARSMLLALHRRWVEAAGGQVVLEDGAGAVGPEVSPLVSYGGEGLEDICRQREFTQPFDIFLQGTVPGNVYRSAAAPPSAS